MELQTEEGWAEGKEGEILSPQTEEGWAEGEGSKTLSPQTDEVPKLWHVPGPKLVSVYPANQPLEAFSLGRQFSIPGKVRVACPYTEETWVSGAL